MTGKIKLRDANILLQSVANKLDKNLNEFSELFSDTEEWLLHLIAAPSYPGSAKRFPVTHADVSRTKKRIWKQQVETIDECVEKDETLPLPAELNQPVRRGLRTASRLANTKLKEASLHSKLRRPAHSISKANDTTAINFEAPPPKRACKDKSNMPKVNKSMATAESSFASGLDSLEPNTCMRGKVEPMETDDDVYTKVQTTNISTNSNFPEKSRLRVKTVSGTQSRKRITKPPIKSVVDSAASRNVKSKASSRQHTVDVFSDSSGFDSEDDNIPIISFCSSHSKAITSGPKLDPSTKEIFDTNYTTGNSIELKRLAIVLHRCDTKALPNSNRTTLRNVKSKASSRQHTVDVFSDSSGFDSEDDNIPIISFCSSHSKAITSGPKLDPKTKEIFDTNYTTGNGIELKRLTIVLHRCNSEIRKSSDHTDTTESKSLIGTNKISLEKEQRNLEVQKSVEEKVILNAKLATLLPKTKVVSAAKEGEEKRKEERPFRREDNDDALLKKKVLIEGRKEKLRKKKEEKERNVLTQKALKEGVIEELKLRVEKKSKEKARLMHKREEKMKMKIICKKEEAKLKAAKIEECRVRKAQADADRIHAKRILENRERKEAAVKETAAKVEKQKQVKKEVPSKPLDATCKDVKPVLIASSNYDYPLPDLSKGNDSNFTEAEEGVIPSWASCNTL